MSHLVLLLKTQITVQLANKEKAMQLLKSQLYEIELRSRMEKQNEIESEKKKIEWGSQIRVCIASIQTSQRCQNQR